MLDGFHVNAVAAAVGTFFRELPEPLLTKELYTEFLRTVGASDRMLSHCTDNQHIHIETKCMCALIEFVIV